MLSLSFTASLSSPKGWLSKITATSCSPSSSGSIFRLKVNIVPSGKSSAFSALMNVAGMGSACSALTSIRSSSTGSPFSSTRVTLRSVAGLRRFFTENCTVSPEFRKLVRLYSLLRMLLGISAMNVLPKPNYEY